MGKWVELCHRCVDLIQQGALLWRLAEQLRDYLAVAFAKGCGRLTEHAVVAASGAAGTVQERVGDASEGRDDDDDRTADAAAPSRSKRRARPSPRQRGTRRRTYERKTREAGEGRRDGDGKKRVIPSRQARDRHPRMPPNARRRNRVERAARFDRWRHPGGPSKLADLPSKHSRASRTVMRVNVPKFDAPSCSRPCSAQRRWAPELCLRERSPRPRSSSASTSATTGSWPTTISSRSTGRRSTPNPTACAWRRSARRPRGVRSSWRSSHRRRTSRSSTATRRSRRSSRSPKG